MYLKDIEEYGGDVDDFETSPFELHFAFIFRSEIQKKYTTLSLEEKELLARCDLILLKNAKKALIHLSKIYSFKESKAPIEEWWWHLDKVVSGEIKLIANATE